MAVAKILLICLRLKLASEWKTDFVQSDVVFVEQF